MGPKNKPGVSTIIFAIMTPVIFPMCFDKKIANGILKKAEKAESNKLSFILLIPLRNEANILLLHCMKTKIEQQVNVT